MRASPLPESLVGTLFTVRQARALGVARNRLRASDIRGFGRDLYFHGTGEPTETQMLRGMLALHPQLWGSHTTAARIHGLTLPTFRAGAAELEVHVGLPRNVSTVQRDGVRLHRPRMEPGETVNVGDLRVTTRVRTLLDLATVLPLKELVAVGDQLVRVPRRDYEGRDTSWAVISDLEALLRRHPRAGGIVRAREAVSLVRVGSDSRPETLLRLSLLDWGLPEPELQIALEPRNPRGFTADMGYRNERIAIHYDGATHRTADQQFSDNARNAAFIAAGWKALVFNANDLKNGFHRAANEVFWALREPA